jgi:signal transduction histidine kinase
MQAPESGLVAAVERMSRALEQLADAPSITVVLDEVLRQAAASLGTQCASVTWRDGAEGLRTLVLPGLSEEAAHACARRLLEQEALTAQGALHRAADALWEEVPVAEVPGARALLAVPVAGAGREGASQGVLVVYDPAPRAFSEDEVKRLGLYARLVHLALERERMLEASRRAAHQARAEAEQAEVLRLSRFQQVAEAFGRALTREEVARVVLEQGLPAVGAVSGTVHLRRTDGPGVELMAAVGLPPELLEAWRRPPSGASPGQEALRGGVPVWMESPEELRARYPAFAEQVVAVPRGAFAFLPLRVDGDVFGVLAFGFAAARRFSVLEKASLFALARQCAQALERARLYDSERSARLRAEEAGRRLKLLADASVVLSSSLDWEATVAGVARLALGAFADWCAVDALEDGAFQRLAVLHADPSKAPLIEALKRLVPDPLHLPGVSDVLRTGRSQWVPQVVRGQVSARTGEGQLEELCARLGLASCIVVPLVARGRTLGALSFVRGEGRPTYGPEDLTFAEELAGRAALAIDNARLLRQAREAEEESRRSAARLHVLAKVSQLVAEAGLDLDGVLDVIARKVSEAIGDACAVRLLSDNGQWMETVVVHHPEETSRALLEAALRVPRRPEEGLMGRVLSTGQTLLLPRLTVEEVREAAPEYLPYVERHGPQSLIAAPLLVHGRTLGGLLVVREARERPFSVEEKVLLESLAARAALAIEDARLYGAATQEVRARDDMLSVAGHELKTPLNALQLQIHLLARMAREAVASSGLAERAERAARTSERLRVLLDDLLDVSRIRAKRLELVREELDLVQLARESVARMSEELARAGCEARVVADGPVVGRWDRLRLEQVLINLLSNAVKYGAGQPVEVRVEGLGAWARLSVRDGGMGIAPEDHARVFDRFERTSSARNIRGLGLGLWITRQLIEAHGGHIRVESAVGQGAHFIVELPCEPAAPQE